MATSASTEPTPSPIKTTTSAASKATTTKKKKVKKKKTSTKKSNAANAAALNTAARSQYQKLLKQREAKLHDAAWLSTVPPPGTSSFSPSSKIESPSFLEQDVEIVNKALEHNGLTMEDVTVEGFACLLEEARRYALSVITDASDYAVHSHMTDNITPADLMLAKEMQEEMDVVTMEALARVAQETNRRVLPPIPENCYNGIILPSAEYTLLGRTFDVVCREDEPSEKETNGVTSGDNQKVDEKSISIPSYGARRGMKQVQISLQSNASGSSISNPSAGVSNAMDLS